MLANGLGFVVITGLTPILKFKYVADSNISLGVLAGLQFLAFILIALVKKK